MSKFIGFKLNYQGITTTIVGGSFNHSNNKALDGFYKVKMAEEISKSCDLAIDTADFCTPNRYMLLNSIPQILHSIAMGQNIYIGCMGGIGRTGFMMAIIAKIMGVNNPVAFTRANFKSHAIETQEQLVLVDSIEVEPYRMMLDAYLALREVNPEPICLTNQSESEIIIS